MSHLAFQVRRPHSGGSSDTLSLHSRRSVCGKAEQCRFFLTTHAKCCRAGRCEVIFPSAWSSTSVLFPLPHSYYCSPPLFICHFLPSFVLSRISFPNAAKCRPTQCVLLPLLFMSVLCQPFSCTKIDFKYTVTTHSVACYFITPLVHPAYTLNGF